MALKTKDVLISAEGRDYGKLFRITEMPAAQTERWGFRAFQAVAQAGVEMPANMVNAGAAAMMVVGLKALAVIPSVEAFALMDELMACVTIVRDKAHLEVASPLLATDIEEVWTRLQLKDEVLEIHTGFSVAGSLQKFRSTPATTSEDSPATPTSPV